MRIAIIGPVHPYKGGIAQHTTELAHRLQSAGHEVEIISWKAQYPFFYPGEQFVPDGKPELPLFPKTKRVLSWKNPAGWLLWARRLKNFDEVIFVWWVPMIQGPVYMNMMKALGKNVHKVMLCHNIVRHSSGPADVLLTKQVFKLATAILVHTDALAEQARALTTKPVYVSSMPAHLPGKPKIQALSQQQHSLLFFGLVRHYKGVDVLIKALAGIPDVKLVVAGEMWGKQQTKLEALIDDLQLGKRVKLLPGYVPSDAIADLFATSDALVMPYRTGTASQSSELAFAYGRPVIATSVGSMPQQIRDGIDGLLCKPNDVESLKATIQHFYEAGVATKLTANIPAIDSEKAWHDYTSTITLNQ